jgi:gamma-glutamyltranspeptidase/glutathione hydrolase
VTVTTSEQTADFPPSPAGITAAQIWAALWRDGGWRSARGRERHHLLAEISKRAYADAGRAFHSKGVGDSDGPALVSRPRIRQILAGYQEDRAMPVPGGTTLGPAPRDQASASVVAADRHGQAVACTFTMNGLFGAVREAPGTGIVIAAPPDPVMRGLPPFAMMAVRLTANHQFQFVGAASGGPVAPVALTSAALGVLVDGLGLERALALPRLFNAAQPDRVAVEDSGTGRGIAQALSAAGHTVDLVPSLGRVNAFSCPRGFAVSDEAVCEVRTDHRGFGLAQRD